MSENSEPIETEQSDAPLSAVAAAPTISHRRILWTMFFVAVCGALLGLAFISAIFGAGVFLGGALSLVNYYWLKNSLRGVFARAVAGEKPRFLATKYFLRYAVFAAILLTVFLTKSLPVTAVLFGLASFAFAIMVEAFILLFSSFFKK